MPLDLVAIPIGHPDDITVRALKLLKEADVVIGEDLKETARFLRPHELLPKPIEILNEHSTPEDVSRLLEICRNKKVALITDCGTPGFCDPGFQLVAQCRTHDVKVSSAPGASSLMLILSLAGARIEKFSFDGFIPREAQERAQYYNSIARSDRPVIFMDTPYRFKKTLEEIAHKLKGHRVVIGIDLTQETEKVFDGPAEECVRYFSEEKAEFIVIADPPKVREATSQSYSEFKKAKVFQKRRR